MPRQYTLFGRNLPRCGSRRISFLLTIIALCACVSILFTLPGAISPDSRLHDYAEHMPDFHDYTEHIPDLHDYTEHIPDLPKLPSVPKIKNPFSDNKYNPFAQPAHPPPRQKNDTYDESSWWADWKWLHVPFSSSLTLDEERSLLPPLRDRPPIYCYYDNTIKKDGPIKDAESAMLLTWRKAWWSHGLRPIILSPAEAMKNPRYEELQRRPDINPAFKDDMMRWMAWESMGGGLLARYTTLPMGPQEDDLLTFLRRGEYPNLIRWEKLGDGLFAGGAADVTNAIKEVLSESDATGESLKKAGDFLSTLSVNSTLFHIDDQPKALAYYDDLAIEGRYAKVFEAIREDEAKGLKMLNRLMNSHLHTTWQNRFTDGIAVLKPLPHHSTHMVTDAWQLAQDLVMCSQTPMLTSCPPNNARCKPCNPSKLLSISVPARYTNASSTLFTIGTVPHPYLTTLLVDLRDKIDVPWIRRNTTRDPWITAMTTDLLGEEVGTTPRVLRFKQAVAGDLDTARSLWLTAEKDLVKDEISAQLDWQFGFAIPHPKDRRDLSHRAGQDHSTSRDGPIATEEELEEELPILEKAREVVTQSGSLMERLASKDKKRLGVVRAASEAWSLADTEAWKFARAYLAQQISERKEWEREESQYVGGSGSESGRQRTWSDRWRDDEEEDGD